MRLWQWLIGYPIAQRVIVHTKTNQSLRGILWHRNAECLILKQTELLSGASKVIPMDGELVIDRNNVDYYQVLVAVSTGDT